MRVCITISFLGDSFLWSGQIFDGSSFQGEQPPQTVSLGLQFYTLKPRLVRALGKVCCTLTIDTWHLPTEQAGDIRVNYLVCMNKEKLIGP